MRFAARAIVALACTVAAVDLAAAATRYDPRLRFRTISTSRFDIHYHQGEEAIARRLAGIAEEVASALDATLGRPSGRVQVILVDQSDLPNGWATPLPYNTIEVTAAAPTAASLIGNTNDWLRLVFTHEYTHIVHLSRAKGWIGGLRRVFGRQPLLFPNQFQPIWQIEGIATWEESHQQGDGRLRAGDFRLLHELGAAKGRLQPIDRASSRIVDWPSGHTPYLYGGLFHEYLADRYGPESLQRLTDETARRPPYFGALAFKKVFGRSLGQLWADFEGAAPVGPAMGMPLAAERLTRHGFVVGAPRFAPDGRLFYSISNPHAFPALMAIDLESRRDRRVVDRYLGTGLGFAGARGIFDQVEIVRDVGQQLDLYAVDLRDQGSGDVSRLTFGSRAGDPDVSPDGNTVVFVVQKADRRELATARLTAGGRLEPVTLVSQPNVDFASPRWSPDGRTIAAERRAVGGASEIVLVDGVGGRVHTLVAAGRNAEPVWTPDGSAVLFSSAYHLPSFQICAVDRSGERLRLLIGAGPHAQSPAVSPDGQTLVFVGLTVEGYDLFSIPLAGADWVPIAALEPAPPAGRDAATDLPFRPYSPYATLLPRFWTPTLESDEGELVVGAATASVDALGRHAYLVEAGWAPARGRPDWQVAYAYDRWRPAFYAAVSDDTDPWRGGERRTTEANAGLLLTSRRIRWSQSVLAELHGSSERLDCLTAPCPVVAGSPVRRASFRAGLVLDAARGFGYSISREEGSRIGTTLEATRDPSRSDVSSLAATVDVRQYIRAWPRHAAIALRGSAAASWGDDQVRRLFSASGSEPQSGGFRFGTDAIGLIRGLREERLLGTRAAVVNADYRFPIVWLERGAGTLPLLLRSIHGAVFVDAGHAWIDRFRGSDIRTSAGAEISMDAVVGYFATLTFTTGAAWRRSPDPDERGLVAFARIGRAF